jgi:hypothetical protein
VQTLINWNATWRYNQNGTELGTGWRAQSYPAESTWPSGQGLLAFEDAPGAYTVHAPISTTLAVSTVVTSFYFRTTFQFSGSTAGMQLVASNLVDDGAVLWLNGSEAGRLRVTAANPNAATLASAGPAVEGQLDTVIITNLALLKQGANTMAVEVHQNANNSSDVAFGMKLLSIRATPLNITAQPQDTVATAGETVVLTVGVTGGPATYRWYRVGTAAPITGQTSSNLNIASVSVGSAGQYFSIITNSISAVTSRVATVTVLADTEGPMVIDARGDTNTFAARGGAQAIAISFNEALMQAVSTNAVNFSVYAGTNFNTKIAFTNVFYNFSQLPRIYLFMTGPGWTIGSNYFVVINGVSDAKGNTICPNTRVPVSWEVVTNLARMDDGWEFHDASVFDPDIYTSTPAWYATNYQTSSSGWWGTGRGILWYDPSSTGFSCAGTPFGKLISFQNQPTLFRRTFNIPAALGTNAVLRLKLVTDDGMILYINGKEAYAHNSASNIVVTAATKARAAADSTCITNITLYSVTNLRPGVNYLAAAVLQSNPEDQSDTSFGLEIDAVLLKNSPLPSDPPANQLVMTMTPAVPARTAGSVQISWPAAFGGYCLQYKTDLNPTLPWITVSNQANPFTGLLSDGPRLYRLAKP